jgi:hypothetical protein
MDVLAVITVQLAYVMSFVQSTNIALTSLLLGLNSLTLVVNFRNQIIHKKENCTQRFSHNYPEE